MATEPNDRLQNILQQTTTPLSTKVSLALHPDSIHGFGSVLVDGAGGPAESAFSAARGALRALHETMVKVEAAHTAALEPKEVGLRGSGTIRMEIPAQRAQ